jgi:hypothetical protein
MRQFPRFEDLSLVNENGRAVAVFPAGAERRAALADSLSWHIARRFQAVELDVEEVLDLRAAGALADRLDDFRGVEGKQPVRINSLQARVLIEAAWAYISERDVEGYQPPEERERIQELHELVDPLFDLIQELERADKVLGG